MSKKADPGANPVSGLSRFGGKPVVEATIKVTNAGDGLSQSLSIEPVEYELGETVCLVIESVVSRVSYENVGDTGVLRRVHTFKAGTATIVDRTDVAVMLDEQQRRNEAAKGVKQLFDAHGNPIDDDGDPSPDNEGTSE